MIVTTHRLQLVHRMPAHFLLSEDTDSVRVRADVQICDSADMSETPVFPDAQKSKPHETTSK